MTEYVNAAILKHFDYFDTNADLRKAAAKFLQGEVKPLDAKMDETGEWPDKLWQKLGRQNLLGVTIPEEYGGIGGNYITECVVSEEISRASGSVGLSTIAHSNLCMGQLNRFGTEFQKSLMLPGLASGTYIGALAMSEELAGSDIMSMRTTAEKVDGGWIINGTKQWITNGQGADVLVVYAKTPTPEDPKALTTFIVYKPGAMSHYTSPGKEDKEGMRGSETAQLLFENCFIPDNMMLGEPYKGAHILKSGLNYERLVLAAGALGLAQAALEDTVKYTAERKQFGQPLAAKDSVTANLIRMQARILAVRNYIYYAARCADTMKKFPHEMAAVAFFEASDMAREVTMDCMRLHGGNGFTRDFPLGRYHRDALLYEVGGGAREVRLDIIAASLFRNARAHDFNTAATGSSSNDVAQQAHLALLRATRQVLANYKDTSNGVPQSIAHELAAAESRLVTAMSLQETSRSVEGQNILDAYTFIETEKAVRQVLNVCRKHAHPRQGTPLYKAIHEIEESLTSDLYSEIDAIREITFYALPASRYATPTPDPA